MAQKKILVTRPSMPDMDEYTAEIKSLWDSHWITNMGAKHRTFQAQLEEYLGVGSAELVVNGHMALEMTLQAMGLEGEVITTPFTFASTTHAIVRSGLTPVFCDINRKNYTIDTSQIESLITENTCAIVPVHVYGCICDIEEIDRIAKKHGLKVIYDAAHAFGETRKGIGVGNFGDASCFSFHATKVFNTIEGGAICYKDRELGERLYDLKNFGIHGSECVSGIGANAKMNEFCAAMGICNLRHIDEEIGRRKKVHLRYRKNLNGIKGLSPRAVDHDVDFNYAYFPLLVDSEKFGADRDSIIEKLAENNIFARKYFYPITSSFECYRGMFDPEATPVAMEISRNILTLPIYAGLSMKNVDRICECIMECRPPAVT